MNIHVVRVFTNLKSNRDVNIKENVSYILWAKFTVKWNSTQGIWLRIFTKDRWSHTNFTISKGEILKLKSRNRDFSRKIAKSLIFLREIMKSWNHEFKISLHFSVVSCCNYLLHANKQINFVAFDPVTLSLWHYAYFKWCRMSLHSRFPHFTIFSSKFYDLLICLQNFISWRHEYDFTFWNEEIVNRFLVYFFQNLFIHFKWQCAYVVLKTSYIQKFLCVFNWNFLKTVNIISCPCST